MQPFGSVLAAQNLDGMGDRPYTSARSL
jgi:hypothetical protein